MSLPKETLKFRIGLSGTFWDKVPQFSILLNGMRLASGYANSQCTFHEFSIDVDEDKVHILEIRLENKTNEDTVENTDKTAILKDMLLNIDSIEIDEIDLGELKWSLSEFIPDNIHRPVLKNCVNLGWNGSFKLKFTSPFYLWLLENM